MTTRKLLLRSLQYHKGIHLAVALGVAVGAATLAGALIVGDSVRQSLRNLTLDRLGRIDYALVADRYFREALAEQMPQGTAPTILIRGGAEAADSGARASQVNLHGVDERFWALYPEAPAPALGLRDVAVNASLARELQVETGSALLLRFQTDTLVPSESVMGRKTENVRTLRLNVAEVLEDRGPGRFGLSPSQQLPLNAFLALGSLQRALEQQDEVNALLTPSDAGPEELAAQLREAAQLVDVELALEARPATGETALQTGRIVLEPVAADAAMRAAEEAGLAATPVLTYLANTMRAGDRELPYSTVSALSETALAGLRPLRGKAVPAGDEIVLDDWAARDLEAELGYSVTLEYFVVGPGGELQTETHDFTLVGVVAMEGLAVDADLAPTYEGMSDVERMGDWDPPFPFDLRRIRAIDEDYWERHRGAPKAFVALETAKRLWTSRFGQLTSIRVAGEAPQEFAQALKRQLDPAAFGLGFQPVKAQSLEASAGATDFSGLFIGFSMFLIASAAVLTALLFRLGVERRAREVGLLLATGETAQEVRKLLLAEGAVVAGLGCLFGLPGAAAYGALMVYGLKTWWSAAVGGSFLELAVEPSSLLAGALVALLIMIGVIWLTLRRLSKLSPRALLAGQAAQESLLPQKARRRAKRIAVVCLLGALVLLAISFRAQAAAQAGGFFAAAALLLTAALAWFRASLAAPSRASLAGEQAPLWRLGVRNGARFPTRSVLSAALVACAAFVIVVVALMRHDVSSREPRLDSGDGGFRFVATSDLPLHQDQLEGLDGVYPFRRKPGEDASCLNLYRPSEPTLLAAPPALVERGGFAFQGALAETPEEEANPWLLLDRDFPDGAVPVFGDMNSVMWILHLGLGDTLEVEDSAGRRRKLIIAGLLSRSIFQSELLLSEESFLELFPDRGGFNLLLLDSADAGAGQALEERFAEHGLDAQTAADRLAGYLVVENTYLSTFLTLGGLGLLLGTLGLAVVMVRNVLERRAELALLRAVGYGRGAISKIVLAENAFVLLFGVLIGAGTAVLASLPHLWSGLAEPPWASLAMTLALILAVGLAAGAIAAGASLRQPLLPSLRRE